MTDSDSDADEMIGTSFDVNEAEKEAAMDNTEFGEFSQRLREKVREMAFGEPIAEAETKCELKREQWDETESDIRRATDELRSEHGAAVPITAVEEMVDTVCRRRDETVTQDNAERRQQARSEVADQNADPEVASVNADASAVEVAEDIIIPDPDVLANEVRGVDISFLQGPENPAVQRQAEKCEMDPKEFIVFLVEEFSDERVTDGGNQLSQTVGEWMEEEVKSADQHGREFWYDGDVYRADSDEEADTSSTDVSLATDGGDSS